MDEKLQRLEETLRSLQQTLAALTLEVRRVAGKRQLDLTVDRTATNDGDARDDCRQQGGRNLDGRDPQEPDLGRRDPQDPRNLCDPQGDRRPLPPDPHTGAPDHRNPDDQDPRGPNLNLKPACDPNLPTVPVQPAFQPDRDLTCLTHQIGEKPENLVGLSPSADNGSSTSGSPTSSKSVQNRVMFNDTKVGGRKSISKCADDSAVVDLFPERTQAGELFSATVLGRRLPPTGTTITDQMDLLHEQVKMLAGEVALCTSSLKRLSEQAASNPNDSKLREQMQKLKDEISEKKLQIRVLEQRMIGSVERTPLTSSTTEMSQALSKLTTQLNERTFELEIKSADNRILQEQLQMKMSENEEMQQTILLLRQQISSLSDKRSCGPQEMAQNEGSPHKASSEELSGKKYERKNGIGSCEEIYVDEHTPTSVMSLNRVFSQDSRNCNDDAFLNSQVLMQAAEIENLKQEKVKLSEEKDGLEIQSQKLAEEASYAKELASSAAVELQNLAEEVTRLSYENAKLTGELAAAKEAHCKSSFYLRSGLHEFKQNYTNNKRPDGRRKPDDGVVDDLQKELGARYQREAVLEAALSEREQVEGELRRRINEAKQREQDLENELANMWVLVAKMRKSGINAEEMSSEGLVHVSKISQIGVRNDSNGFFPSAKHSFIMSKEDENCQNEDGISSFEELRANYQNERKKCKELESIVSRMKGEDISSLDVATLEELQNFHVEAITKICHTKCTNHVL